MKHVLILLLVLMVLTCFASCTEPEAITYYYLRDPAHYLSGQADGVIVGEIHEAASQVQDLYHLLILYLHGPINENFHSPFPKGTTLKHLEETQYALTIQLSNHFSALNGTDLTLACACIARTCFGLTDVESVTITSDGTLPVSMTLTRDSLLLIDDITGE